MLEIRIATIATKVAPNFLRLKKRKIKKKFKKERSSVVNLKEYMDKML